MAAFERVKCGIPELDQALDNIRLGDNVVFRVSDLSEFRLFLDPYLEQIAAAQFFGRGIDRRNAKFFQEHLLYPLRFSL